MKDEKKPLKASNGAVEMPVKTAAEAKSSSKKSEKKKDESTKYGSVATNEDGEDSKDDNFQYSSGLTTDEV
jgi:hypothetical protein